LGNDPANNLLLMHKTAAKVFTFEP